MKEKENLKIEEILKKYNFASIGDFADDLYWDVMEGSNGKIILDGRATIKELKIIIEIMESLNMRNE